MVEHSRGWLFAAVAAAGLMMAVSPAMAGPTLTFSLNQISDPAIGSGSAGTVTLTQNSLTQVDVNVQIAPYLFINSGGPHTPFAFNVSLSGLTVAFVTPSNGTFASGTLSYNAAGGSNTPYGSFSRAIDSSAGNGTSNGYSGVLDFTVSRVAGISTTDFLANAGGFTFSADVSNGVSTGAVASQGGSTVTVPEPMSLGLLGGALLTAGLVQRRQRKPN